MLLLHKKSLQKDPAVFWQRETEEHFGYKWLWIWKLWFLLALTVIWWQEMPWLGKMIAWKGALKCGASDSHGICSLLFHVLLCLDVSASPPKPQFWKKRWNVFKFTRRLVRKQELGFKRMRGWGRWQMFLIKTKQNKGLPKCMGRKAEVVISLSTFVLEMGQRTPSQDGRLDVGFLWFCCSHLMVFTWEFLLPKV